MRHLVLALHAEGPTDQRFLQPVIRRALRDIQARTGAEPFEIAEDFLGLGSPDRSLEAVIAAALRTASEINLLIVHTDGVGNRIRAIEERVTPIATALRPHWAPDRFGCVAVVPVRETEAWPLADPDAVCNVFGTTRAPHDLGLANFVATPAEVERILDPKQFLRQAYTAACGGRRRPRGQRVESFFNLLGEHVDLRRLRRVPAYSEFEEELEHTLRSLRLHASLVQRRGPAARAQCRPRAGRAGTFSSRASQAISDPCADDLGRRAVR